MSDLDRTADLADALLGAEEILEVLHRRGTRGVEQECNAGRIFDVYQNVLAAKRHLMIDAIQATVVTTMNTLGETLGLTPVTSSPIPDDEVERILASVEQTTERRLIGRGSKRWMTLRTVRWCSPTKWSGTPSRTGCVSAGSRRFQSRFHQARTCPPTASRSSDDGRAQRYRQERNNMSEAIPVPQSVVHMVEEYVESELSDAAKYSNSTPLDESGIWSLHRLAARIYASGFDAGERVEADRSRAVRRRERDMSEAT